MAAEVRGRFPVGCHPLKGSSKKGIAVTRIQVRKE
jgi:hypothetical protein